MIASNKTIMITQNNKHKSENNPKILNTVLLNAFKFVMWCVLIVIEIAWPI